MIDGSRKGVIRFGPFSTRIFVAVSTASMPPTPLPMSTPNRLLSTVSFVKPPSANASLPAPIAKCVYRSYRFASFGSQNSPMSKSLTSLAILTALLDGSKRVTGPMPHLPSSKLEKKVSGSLPSEVRVPRPVTTTCEH